MDDIKVKIEQAKRQGDFARASNSNTASCLNWVRNCKRQKAILRAKNKTNSSAPKLARTKVAEIVSRMTGIPVSKMMEGERDKLLKMEEVLHRRVVGQDEAVRAVSDAIRRSRSVWLIRTNHGSFLFLGPTGVGKNQVVQSFGRLPV